MKSDQNKYLDKVFEHIMYHTKVTKFKIINYDLFNPLGFLKMNWRDYLDSFSENCPPPRFKSLCLNTYGLNKKETEYLWKKFRDAVTEEIRNGKSIG